MFLKRLGENIEVIQIDHDKSPKIFVQYLIHEPLKRCRCVTQSEWHHLKLKGAEFGDEGGLFSVFRTHGYLPVAAKKIQGSEEASTLKCVQDVIDAG